MAAERKPGSNRGRTSVEWEQAFTYWASLPSAERSYQAVADYYEVSVRTVEKHGRDGRWRDRLRRIQADAAAAADAELTRERAEMFSNIEKLIEASLTTYAQQLRAGTVKVAPVDLQRLFKLRRDLWEQEAAETVVADHGAVVLDDSPEETTARKVEVVRALYEAGAFDHLLALINTEEEQHEQL